VEFESGLVESEKDFADLEMNLVYSGDIFDGFYGFGSESCGFGNEFS